MRTKARLVGVGTCLIIGILVAGGLTRAAQRAELQAREPVGQGHKITLADVQSKDVTLTQQYICRIQAHRHIEVRTPTDGYVKAISIKEGQAVKKGDLLLQVEPGRGKEKQDPIEGKTISIKAPFDGLVGRLSRQEGSLILKGEAMTTLSDNSMMWVYFNVPEQHYLDFMEELSHAKEASEVELKLANDHKYPQPGKIGAIEAEFNKETGSIAFRADFPNPDGVLRHGQVGTVLIRRALKDAVVVPQRATFEKLDKRYVYTVGKDRVAHQREIAVQNEVDDLFVIQKGIAAGEKIVLEGVKLVREGDKVEQQSVPAAQ